MTPDLKVVQFPARCGDIVPMLRKLADDIESGEIESERIVVVVDEPSGLSVRGLGDADIWRSIAMLTCGATKLTAMINDGEAQ